jgi:hypothetical protein
MLYLHTHVQVQTYLNNQAEWSCVSYCYSAKNRDRITANALELLISKGIFLHEGEKGIHR